MFLRNGLEFASRAYCIAAITICRSPEGCRYLCRLHEPALPEPGAAPSDRNALMPHLQEMILEDMRDPSMMMEFYARYCHDDPGLCARYAEHLRWS